MSCRWTEDVDGYHMRLVSVSRKIGFRYPALRVGDEAINNPNVTQETKNEPADVLFEHDWRGDEKDESTTEAIKKQIFKEMENQGLFFGTITYLYRLVITVVS
jgi:hypothetical protein